MSLFLNAIHYARNATAASDRVAESNMHKWNDELPCFGSITSKETCALTGHQATDLLRIIGSITDSLTLV